MNDSILMKQKAAAAPRPFGYLLPYLASASISALICDWKSAGESA